jgi:hypothetical protein
MFASRIFAFARTSRCAIVGSDTRNACAISGVVSPPSSRSVRATWAGIASAGWQHVKISRSRSSCTGALLEGLVARMEQRGLGVAILTRCLAAQPVDRAVARGRDDPTRRGGRQPVRRPAPEGCGERVLDRFLGDVDVAEDADQDGHRAPVLLAEDTLDL